MAKAPTSASTFETATPATTGPTIFSIRSDVTIPERKSKRGGIAKYPFDLLNVGQSFGVIGKTAKSMSSAISAANKKAMVQATNPDGTPAFEMRELKDADGNLVSAVPTTKKIMVAGKKFFAIDVDSAVDPDKATVRVFREI